MSNVKRWTKVSHHLCFTMALHMLTETFTSDTQWTRFLRISSFVTSQWMVSTHHLSLVGIRTVCQLNNNWRRLVRIVRRLDQLSGVRWPKNLHVSKLRRKWPTSSVWEFQLTGITHTWRCCLNSKLHNCASSVRWPRRTWSTVVRSLSSGHGHQSLLWQWLKSNTTTLSQTRRSSQSALRTVRACWITTRTSSPGRRRLGRYQLHKLWLWTLISNTHKSNQRVQTRSTSLLQLCWVPLHLSSAGTSTKLSQPSLVRNLKWWQLSTHSWTVRFWLLTLITLRQMPVLVRFTRPQDLVKMTLLLVNVTTCQLSWTLMTKVRWRLKLVLTLKVSSTKMLTRLLCKSLKKLTRWSCTSLLYTATHLTGVLRSQLSSVLCHNGSLQSIASVKTFWMHWTM